MENTPRSEQRYPSKQVMLPGSPLMISAVRHRYLRKVLCAVLASALGCLGVSFVISANAKRNLNDSDLVSGKATSPESIRRVTSQVGSRSKVETEIVTLRPEGCEPTTITRPRGPFILLIDNVTGLDDTNLTFNLDRVAGARMRQVGLEGNKAVWADLFDLPPGTYVFSEASNPKWACAIVISPN